MRPAARLQTAIELLDAILAAIRANGAPADRVIAEGFRNRRYAGSKDRRAIRDLVYRAIRACGPMPEHGRAALLRLAEEEPELKPLFDGSPYGAAALGAQDQPAAGGLAPPWLEQELAASGTRGQEAEALLDRAPLDIRINPLRPGAENRPALPVAGERTVAPYGLRFATGTRVEEWPAWRDGQIEVQDTASQLACLATGARPGETVIDLCAGAGGKTLALAAMMENKGRLLACDTDRKRLSRLSPRAMRAGATIIETMLLNPPQEAEQLALLQQRADLVLVDAPCSGSGTWRRNPEARWRITPEQLVKHTNTQDRLLDIGAQLVRPGGRLVFATCSLLDAEGPVRAAHFLNRYAKWQRVLPDLPAGRPYGDGIRLSPYHDGTDGFYIACFRAPC